MPTSGTHGGDEILGPVGSDDIPSRRAVRDDAGPGDATTPVVRLPSDRTPQALLTAVHAVRRLDRHDGRTQSDPP